jgi:hypothetical protein
LVRDSEHCHGIASNLVKDRVRKVTENVSPDCILVFGAHQRTDTKPINGPKGLGSKSIGRNWAALKVPEECLSDFCLSLGQNLDYKASHRVLSLALASVQETAFTVPARRAACRDLISCRQASAIEESSLPSRLSSSATVKAARSAGWQAESFVQKVIYVGVHAAKSSTQIGPGHCLLGGDAQRMG